MEIIPKGKGVWQAGKLWITEEGMVKDAVMIELMDPLSDWGVVYGSYKKCIVSQEKFLSLSLGLPEDYHAIRSDFEKSARLGLSLNVSLLISIAEQFLSQAKIIQQKFPVTEAKEYTLQADVESYFHEIESPLYQMRISSLKALEKKCAMEGFGIDFEKERAALSAELMENFRSQAEILDQISAQATLGACLSPELKPFAELAAHVALVDRGVEMLPFKEKLEIWLTLFSALGLKPAVVGSPNDPSIRKLLKDLFMGSFYRSISS